MRGTIPILAALLLAPAVTAKDLPPSINPPPINLQIKDAPLREMVQALSESTDRPLAAPAPGKEGGGDGKNRFTLEVQQKPFWEVFQLLDRQQPLFLEGRPVENVYTGNAGSPAGLAVGGFYFIPIVIRRHKTVKPQLLSGDPAQQAAARQDMLSLNYVLYLDPRIAMISAHPPRVLEVIDDQGHKLQPSPQEFDLRSGWGPTLRMDAVWQCVVDGAIGTKIVSFKGEAWFEVGEGEIRKELPDPAGAPKTVEFAGQKITCTAVAEKDGTSVLHVSRCLPPKGLMTDALPIQIKAQDATGRTLWRFSATNEYLARPDPSTPVVNDSPPLANVAKMLLTAPAERKVHHIPFEFKDLVIPQ